ncbi:MAG: hypothetical protein GF313_16420 [Caldithrix sp.]|nr:hypothetical protein [Caldithrix sp.]
MDTKKLQVETLTLKEENEKLLGELEKAYKDMMIILENSEQEKEIAYRELGEKYKVLEKLYVQLSNKENMLIHMEKLSSIGQFITEIIHELKNPLTVISAVIDVVLLNPDLPEATKEKLNRIPAQVERMKNYLNRFRAMAYKEKEDFKPFSLNSNLRDFLATIEIIKPKNVSIDKNLCDDELIVNGDPYQVTQIFLNLAKNAFDAMENNGDLFTVRSNKETQKMVKQYNTKDYAPCQNNKEWERILGTHDHFAVLDFHDNGNGIPVDLITNIFDAFFTTKNRGKGTGLGLSIATDITIRHNANLMVKSKLDKGTDFKFIIPLLSSNEEKVTA